MMTLGIDQLAQHIVVTVIAAAALIVVARRVFGVFDRRSAATAPTPQTGAPAPGCSHCAAGAAAQSKHKRA